jgi:stage IV sporulation protein FB
MLRKSRVAEIIIVFIGEPERTAYDLHFSIAGIPVRVHPFFWLIAVFMGAQGGLDIRLMLWIVIFFVSILIHELGHAFTMRHYGETPRIVLYAMGGLAIADGGYGFSSRSRGYNPFQQILILLAGPGAGFLFAAIVIAVASALKAEITFHAPELQDMTFWSVRGILNPLAYYVVVQLLFVNIFWGLVNLLPVFPLDGGQIARQLLVLRDPYDGVRKSLLLSVWVAGAVAVFAFVRLRQEYLALMFAMLAFSCYASLQQIGGSGGRGSRW